MVVNMTPGPLLVGSKFKLLSIKTRCPKRGDQTLNTRLGWKGFPGTNTLAYYGNRKLRP